MSLTKLTESIFAFASILADKFAVSVTFSFETNAESTQVCLVNFAVSALFNFKSSTFCVAVLMGNKAKLVAPVPPRATGTMPDIFSASTLFANIA